MTFPIKHSAGIGLIEVLVTTVVVAVGLLAVASLQGNLMGGSHTNKTRAEAQSLANTKIEQLRDSIEKTGASGYDALASSTANESIAGVTETFSRSWTVTDQAGPERKQISVTVNWGDGSIENQVAVQSIIAFDSLGSSLLAAKGSGDGAGSSMSGPSTNAESSDEITETIKLATAGTPDTLVTVDGKTYIVADDPNKASRAYGCADSSLSLTAFENDLYTRRTDFDGVSGNEAIELYEKVVINDVEYCIPRIRYNGGVIIPIRGVVHSAATDGNGNNATWLDVSLFTFNATESGTYCVFNPEVGTRSAPYVCYIGGNCTGFAGTFSDDVTACPGSISAAKVGPGGWRGKVGLLGVAAQGKNVCFAEELAGAPSTLDTARNYYTRNAVGGINEGINKPYSCHDFLIINGKTTEAKVHQECVAQADAIAGFILASKDIRRDISGANIFDPIVDTTYCAGAAGIAYTITGTVTGASTAPFVSVADGISSSDCTASQESYTCTITTITNSVTISGVYDNQPVSCNLALASSTPSPTGCTLAFTSLPVYTITGQIIAATAAAADAVSLKVIDVANTINCINNQDYSGGYNTYTCAISTASTTGVTMEATAASGYSVSPTTYALPTFSGSTSPVTGGNFTASVTPIYTISGSISLGTNVDNLTSVTAAVNTDTGSCTITPPGGGWKKNTTGAYSCTVYAGSNSLTVAISPTCSNTKNGNTPAFKKYTMSSTGATSTTGTGQLVIDLGTVSSNQTKNITVAESTTGC